MHSLQIIWGCCRIVHSNWGSSTGRGAARVAPKPYWAYRGQKRSDKAEMANPSHPVGKADGWGGKYVEGGYEIDGQFFPLPGIHWVWKYASFQ